MKKSFRWFPGLLAAALCANTALAAPDGDLSARLNTSYRLYKQDPGTACRQLEDALTSTEASALPPEELRKGYAFLANGLYQQKQLDQAAVYYRKEADLSPADPQPLINIGHIYSEQGDSAAAEKAYREALLRASGNKTQQDKIQALIERLPGRLKKNFTVSTGLGYDSNVNSGPNDTVHLLYDTFNYTLDNNAKPREDFYAANGVTAAFSKALDSGAALLVNLGAQAVNYFSEHDFNLMTLSASTGYKKTSGVNSVTFSPFVNYQTLAERAYQITGGMNLSGAVKASDKVTVWPFLGWFARNFYNETARDAAGVTVGSSGAYTLNPKTWVTGSLFYTFNNADHPQYTYQNVFLGTSLQRLLWDGVKATLGYNLQLYSYDAPDPAFGTSREDDGHTVYAAINYALKKLLKTDAALNLSVSYNKNNSNHSFQDRERIFSALKLTFAF